MHVSACGLARISISRLHVFHCVFSLYDLYTCHWQIWADDYLGGATVDLKAIGHAPTDVLLRLERTDAKTGELRARGELVRAFCVCVCVCGRVGAVNCVPPLSWFLKIIDAS